MNNILLLKNNFDIIGLKTSTEDEGASFDNIVDIVTINKVHGFRSTLKIGGCEAKSDIVTAQKLKIENIVAPMIESAFAANKFISAVDEIFSKNIDDLRFYINIESIASIKNVEEIISTIHDRLFGVVVGRSDLSKSLGLTKKDTNSKKVLEHTRHVFKIAKKYNLETTFGGNLNSESLSFIKSLMKDNLIDRVETRTVICNVNKKLTENYSLFIENAIELEKEILKDRAEITKSRLDKINKRIIAISGRKNFLNKVEKSEESVLVIDFDNVIHNMTKGYYDGTIYGDPLPGTSNALSYLSKKYKIIVYTCKANPERPLVGGKSGIELILGWLEKNNLSEFVDSVTFSKPNAIAYIDDKGIEFKNWNDCIVKLKEKGLY
tara:strand:+ start:4435 stop:5571 length:1137 start_codon:yes stop_codon:yes gene_type:complete